MDKEIKLIPGICDTKNRHYLPVKLLDGKTTVNENGNNSQVYPGNLKEYRAVLADDIEDVRYEYVPNSYDPEKKTPLVGVFFSMVTPQNRTTELEAGA